jgi:2-polyprenyl-3-methyl-5-hydroxy-6-metoxy-1,4-benzoquinol methylase
MNASALGDCPLCDRSAFRELVAKDAPERQWFYRCGGCGLVRMVSDRPERPDYWDDEGVTLQVYSNDTVRAEMRARYERYLPVITALCGGTGKVLDAGCGIGNFLVFAREAGWSVAGVEVSEKASAIARSRGLDVERARLEDSQLPAAAFDAVTLWDVLAQIDTPLAALCVVQEKLKPGGTLFLETPNEGFWMRSVFRTAFQASGGRVDLLRYFYYPDHRFYFTAGSLHRMLEKTGFRDIRVWQDVTSPAKASLKIAPGRFPLCRVVLPVLPAVLGLMRHAGMGNKLIVSARRA